MKLQNKLLLTIITLNVVLLLVVESWAMSPVASYISQFLGNARRLETALTYAPTIEAESKAAGIDPMLLTVTIALESSFKPNVKSRVGALGLTQRFISSRIVPM